MYVNTNTSFHYLKFNTINFDALYILLKPWKGSHLTVSLNYSRYLHRCNKVFCNYLTFTWVHTSLITVPRSLLLSYSPLSSITLLLFPLLPSAFSSCRVVTVTLPSPSPVPSPPNAPLVYSESSFCPLAPSLQVSVLPSVFLSTPLVDLLLPL